MENQRLSLLFMVVLFFLLCCCWWRHCYLLWFAVVFMLGLLLVVVVGSVFGVGHVIVSVLSGDVVSVVGIVVTHWG